MQIPLLDDPADITKHSLEKYFLLWRFYTIAGQCLPFWGFPGWTPFTSRTSIQYRG